MSLINGGIRSTFGRVFGSIYEDGFLIKTTRSENETGDIQETIQKFAIKYHMPLRSDAYRAAAGYADSEVEVIILSQDVEFVPNTNDRIEAGSKTYSVVKAREDGAHSQWKIKAKIWNG